MPFNTTAAFYAFEARKHLPDQAAVCQFCCHALEMSDQFIHWLIRQSETHPFVNRDMIAEFLPLGRLERMPLIRRYFEALGYGGFTTLDSHSRLGSVVVDFNRSLLHEQGYAETFDLVDNNGVTEHVFDQRAVFENIHHLCRVGGIMQHRVPMYGVLNIMLYNLTPAFLHALALANGYEILDLRVGNRWGDTVKARLPGQLPPPDEPFRASIPLKHGHLRGVGTEGPGDDLTVAAEFLPPEMHLPEFLEFQEMTAKSPMWNMGNPLTRVCYALEQRAIPFRPAAAGEIYALALFRKIRDVPFVVPFQNNNLDDIEPLQLRERYRNQFEALGIPLEKPADVAPAIVVAAPTPQNPQVSDEHKGARIFIEKVQTRDFDREKLLGFAFTSPEPGFSAGEYSVDISGWIVGRSQPVRRIEVLCGRDLLHTAEVRLARPEVVTHVACIADQDDWKQRLSGVWSRRSRAILLKEAAASGFRASVSLLGLPEIFKLRVRAVLSDGSKIGLGDIRGHRRLLRTKRWPRLQPLLLSGLDGSGSTWLMHLLGKHPRIVAPRECLADSGVGLHAMRGFLAQSAPGPGLLGRDAGDARAEEWLRTEYVERLAAQAQDTVEAFYAQAAKQEDKPGARYFAETALLDPRVAALFAELYPQGREIFLVQDFRDLVCSRISSVQGAEVKPVSFESLVREIAGRAKDLLAQWKMRSAKAHLVRYEDLVLKPTETMAAVAGYLEIAHEEAWHLAPEDSAHPVGLWRKELAPAQQRLCEDLSGEALHEFGFLDHP